MFKRTAFTLIRPISGLSLLIALSACNASSAPENAPTAPTSATVPSSANASAVDQTGVINNVSASLQACSYDGEPVSFNGKSGDAPSDCRDMVAKIMNFSGLPQNFVVVQADVPNAAAVLIE